MINHLFPFLIITPACIYGLISLWCGVRFFYRKKPAAAHFPPITIIKPVTGSYPETLANFTSFCRQDYPSFQLLFTLASTDDPVLPVIEQLIKDFPAVDISVVVNAQLHGPNYKVCKLINAYPEAKHDIIIICDSDVRVEETYLRDVCAPFSDTDVGVVTSLYRASKAKGIAGALEASGFSLEMAPNVIVARKLEGLSFALGASMAIRREVLEKIGGFPALVDYLADDYQLGNKAGRAGYHVELADSFVEIDFGRETLPEVLTRQIRWARTMRVSRPWGYFASGITLPFPAALLAMLMSGFSAAGYAAVLALYTCRTVVAIIYSRYFVRDKLFPKWLWLLLLRDLVTFVTWALSFLGNRVKWRGHEYRILPGGKITEI